MFNPFRKSLWLTMLALLSSPSCIPREAIQETTPTNTSSLEEIVETAPSKPENQPIDYEAAIQRDQYRIFNILLPDKIFNGYMEPYGTLFVIHSPGLEYSPDREWIGSPEEGDDVEIAKVREIIEYRYFLNGPLVSYQPISSSVCRCSSNGFGFRYGSNQTSTGFRHLFNYRRSYPYGSVGKGLFSVRIGGLELIDTQGNLCYSQKNTPNSDEERGVYDHGLSIRGEESRDIGSHGCIHLTTDYAYYMWDVIEANENVSEMIMGNGLSNLPQEDINLILEATKQITQPQYLTNQ